MAKHHKDRGRSERRRSDSAPPMPAKQPKSSPEPDGGEVMSERADEDEITARAPRSTVELPEDEQ